MKKILFASTALVASAGFAAAEISFSGEAGFGVTYLDGRVSVDAGADGVVGTADDVVTAIDDWQPDYYTTLSVAMTGETDGGLSFGADFDITMDGGATAVGDTEVYVEGGFGKLTVGAVGSATDAKLGLSDIGYSGLGMDNVAEALIDAGDIGNIMYSGSFGDFTVAASYDMAGVENFSLAAIYSMGDYEFGLGYDDWGNASNSSVISVKLGADIGDIALDALYSRNDDLDVTSYGLTAAYTMGAATVTAAYSEVDVAGASADAYGLGVSYDLGGGASVNAGVGEVGGVTVADLGIIMTF
ncbi:porin [Aliiroseovarius sp. S253]|uniref:porin n=1 Tax=Aliiroseovarius sp. S253 TaxID=3415133 RepID=UPI003C7AB247